ncbi:MAG TPA: hypothetical protein PKM59_04825 [Thermodesulfobacteriota bacterium]|nr:hypothetical protein [Thermodesulfobacteriota bacterium]HNU70402.1 hypothetical protein [Thermodesulfobacteriota bacterium]
MKEIALFWGTPKRHYNKTPLMCDEASLDHTIVKMIRDYVTGFDSEQGKYVLGLPEIVVWVENPSNRELSIDDAWNHEDLKMISTLLYLSSIYLPEQNCFQKIDKEFGCILNACTGWDENKSKKVSCRVNMGLAESLKNLTKKQISAYTKCKLTDYVLQNFFHPGKLWEELQQSCGISACIINTPEPILVTRDGFSCSCDHVPKINMVSKSETKLVTYQIDSGLVLGIKKIAENKNLSFTYVFEKALSV